MADRIPTQAVDVRDDMLPCIDTYSEIKKIVTSGWFILEQPQGVVMDVIGNLTESMLADTTSVRAFSETAEVRLEREFGEPAFQRRIIRTGEGEALHYSEYKYLLAKTKKEIIRMPQGNSGESLLKCYEYFCFDKDGMAWPAFERLVGVELKPAK